MNLLPILRQGRKRNRPPDPRTPFLLFVLLCIFLHNSAVRGQGYRSGNMFLEAGSGINLSFFDVRGGQPGISTQVRAMVRIRPSWRVGANVGLHHTRGTDLGTPNSGRGYEFTSNMNEISLRGYYVVEFNRYPPRKYKTRLEPKAYAGIGVVQVQPVHNQLLHADENAGRFDVAPLFSSGIACSYRILNQFSAGMEAGACISTSDFLEGFSDQPRGHTPDYFLSFMITLMYHVSKEGY